MTTPCFPASNLSGPRQYSSNPLTNADLKLFMPLYDFTDPTNALIDPFKKFPHLAPNLHAAAQNGSLLQTPLTHFSHVLRAEDIGSFRQNHGKIFPHLHSSIAVNEVLFMFWRLQKAIKNASKQSSTLQPCSLMEAFFLPAILGLCGLCFVWIDHGFSLHVDRFRGGHVWPRR